GEWMSTALRKSSFASGFHAAMGHLRPNGRLLAVREEDPSCTPPADFLRRLRRARAGATHATLLPPHGPAARARRPTACGTLPARPRAGSPVPRPRAGPPGRDHAASAGAFAAGR